MSKSAMGCGGSKIPLSVLEREFQNRERHRRKCRNCAWCVGAQSRHVAIEEIHVDSPPKKSTMWQLLRFIWGKMRTTAPEAAFQRALRTFSKEAGGNVRIYVILVKGEVHAARHTFCRRSPLVS